MASATYPDGSIPELLEVARPATFLFAAGQETVTKLLSAAVQTLGDQPEFQRILRENRDLIPGFIEEALRMQSPTKVDFRLARKTTTLAGVHIPAGTVLMLCLGAANRDPRKFDNPNEFQLDRKNVREHIAFGRGIHTCAGAPLARVEGASPCTGYSTACATSPSASPAMARPISASTPTSQRFSCAGLPNCTSSSQRRPHICDHQSGGRQESTMTVQTLIEEIRKRAATSVTPFRPSIRRPRIRSPNSPTAAQRPSTSLLPARGPPAKRESGPNIRSACAAAPWRYAAVRVERIGVTAPHHGNTIRNSSQPRTVQVGANRAVS